VGIAWYLSSDGLSNAPGSRSKSLITGKSLEKCFLELRPRLCGGPEGPLAFRKERHLQAVTELLRKVPQCWRGEWLSASLLSQALV